VTNVFARAIGMPRRPLEAADALAAREEAGALAARAVDVGTVNGRHFLFTAGVGFTGAMAETAEKAPDRKARLGQLHFAASGILEIARRYLRHPPEMLVEADGLRDRAVTVVVQNCEALTYFGPRQIRVCEHAGLGTGALSLALLRRTNPADVASVVARLLTGRGSAVERHPQVCTAPGLAGARVRGAGGVALPVDADGEFLGTFPEVVFGVRPAALRVVS
jgi:diacylglycerol kinase family enzyme